MQASSWKEIEGGRDAFDRAYTQAALLAAVKESAFQDHLDELGPPGPTRWDPMAAEVEQRGHTFQAELVGSFDGSSWLWSWANPYLSLGADCTTLARRLRDTIGPAQDGGALRTPMIETSDRALPWMMGAMALAHAGSDGLYIANSSQVYAIRSGQVPLVRPTVSALQRAMRILETQPGIPYDPVSAAQFAAHRLGLQVRREEAVIVIGDELRIDAGSAGFRPLATVLLPRAHRLEEIVDVLAHAGDAPAFVLEDGAATSRAEGCRVRVSVTDEPADVEQALEILPEVVREEGPWAAVASVEVAVQRDYVGGFTPANVDPLGLLRDRMWVPDPRGRMPRAALRIEEQLARLEGAVVFDRMLATLAR